MIYSPRQVENLNEIANRYRSIVERSILAELEKLRNTGAGVDSVKVEVERGNANSAPVINITFAEHLNILDRRRLQWTRLPNIEKLLQWAETKKSDKREAHKLAWSVAYRQKTEDRWKARPWRRKSLSKVLREMNSTILSEYEKALDADFQQVIDTALKTNV